MVALTDIADFSWQINNGLNETASCANCIAYDSKYGLVFSCYLTGLQCTYGESTGKLCLSVFPPRQPWNARHVTVDEGIGISRGILCNAVYSLGEAKVRMMFTYDRRDKGTYIKDYDFLTDTVSEEKIPVYLRLKSGDILLDTESYCKYLLECGISFEAKAAPIINRVTEYNGELYTAITLDSTNYPVLCKIEDNVLVPFAVCSELNIYEFRFYKDGSWVHAVYRDPKDDTGVGRCGYIYSRDNGKTWIKKVFEDGIQSRPDIYNYYGKPLIIYNYLSDESVENFPTMHHHRNAIKMIYSGKVIFDSFSKYGIVEHETMDICGDLYMMFSNCEQALMLQNDAMWQEDGIKVENAKEKSNWVKIGYLIGD